MTVVLSATIFDVFHDLIIHFRKEKLRKFVANSEINTEVERNLSSINYCNEEQECLLENPVTSNEKIIEHIFIRLIQSFSIYKNIQKLFHIPKDEHQLMCLHGIRFFSLAWVILGHTYVFIILYADNIAIFGEWIRRFSFMFIINGVFSVDTFFLVRFVLNVLGIDYFMRIIVFCCFFYF